MWIEEQHNLFEEFKIFVSILKFEEGTFIRIVGF